MLTGRKLVLGVSGSIAAYKAVYLLRRLMDEGAEVWPVLTAAATRFVGPLTFSVLSHHRTVVDLWAAAEAGEIGHVEMAHRAEALIFAPATADLLQRLAEGRADDPLCAIALSSRAPWVIAPAMETGMWEHPQTQHHVQVLRQRGAHFVEPESGGLGSGREGMGRLAEPEAILETVGACLSRQDLADEKVLITAGPTREPIDPARFLSNPSSGKMGYALARAARRRGAAVTLISGPTALPAPPGVPVIRIETTADMLSACQKNLSPATLLIMAAAPADYRSAAYSPVKLKKQDAGDSLSLGLSLTPDILKTLAPRTPARLVIAFAAESHEVTHNAQRKLDDKGVDLVVANDITDPQAGFAVDTNRVWLVSSDAVTDLGSADKNGIADKILDAAIALRSRRKAELARSLDDPVPHP